MTDSNLAAVTQSFAPGTLIELFQLDTTSLGGSIYYFTASSNNYGPIAYGGISYTPIDIEATGFEYSGTGTLPTPHIKIANTTLVLSAAVITLNDLVGAVLTRIRTFAQFLDTGLNPDSNAQFIPDVYNVEQKVNHNKVFIEWQLSAAMDQEGRYLPSRIILRDVCSHTYRFWDGSDFDYTKASCPYTGTSYFDTNDTPQLSAANDTCGKHLSSCISRFGQTGTLPTWQMPGVGQII
jgi:lambda family phage minor tail protein L